MPKISGEEITNIFELSDTGNVAKALKITGLVLGVAGVGYGIKKYLEHDWEKLDNAQHFGGTRRYGREYNGPVGPDPRFNQITGQFENQSQTWTPPPSGGTGITEQQRRA